MNSPTRTLRLFCSAAITILAFAIQWPAQALPDSLALTVTNTWTKQPVVFNLQRYNLRATNYQVRIFYDATNYTLLPTNQIPEPATYRGRITGDPGAFVVGSFKADGKFYYSVSYGSRWQASVGNADPYDGTNRLSWGGWGASVSTPYVPSLGYATNAAPAANQPVHLNWTSGFNTNAPVSYGGPPYLNNLKLLPVQRVRVALDSDLYRFFSNLAGNNITTAILMQESRINDVDFEQARDLGICYQIPIVCVRTNVQAPYTTTTGNLSELGSFWNRASYGYSSGVGTSGLYDMVHGSVNVADAGGWAGVPGDFSVMDPDWCGFASGHEMGHNWGQGHYNSVRDYTGDNFWHITMTGSGFGHSTRDVQSALNLRRNQWKGGIEWVEYNADLPPHASPDLVTTKTNSPVSVNVLLNDYIGNSNTLSIVSFETNTAAGGLVTNLGAGVLRYTPPNNFVGYDLFRYYVAEPSGLKSLAAAKVFVTSDSNPLLANWTLNETNGTTASESTGNGQAATLYGSANFTSGSVPGIGGGTALHLDGAGYARLRGTWCDPYSASISLSLWFKLDAAPAGEQMLFMKSSQSSGAPGIRLGLNGSSIFFSGATHGGTASFSAQANFTPQAGIWYHVVGQIDRTSNLSRLWVNGVEYTATSNTRSIPAGECIMGDNWPCLGMANDGGGSKSWLTGTIDDVRFYSKVLTGAEVAALYSGAGLLPVGGPSPADGEINVAMQPVMKWTPGATTNFQYRVYVGTNQTSVELATTNSAEYKGLVASATYSPSLLNSNTAYFWRIDEVLGTNTIAGPVWAFNTAVDAIHGSLRLYLSLDSRDTVGTTTYDRAGAPFHDGTLNNGPVLASAQVYQGLAFNGSTAYVETPALNMNSSNVTLLAWIKSAGAQISYSGLIFCRGGATISGLDFRGTTGQLGYHWNDESGSYNFASNLTPPTNEWALVALVVTPSSATFYLGRTNGTLQTATRTAAHVLEPFDGPLGIGRDSSSGRNFNGMMDEVGVWNRALTTAEISQILTNGINGMSFAGSQGVPAADPATFTWVGESDAYWTNSLNWATNGIPGPANTVYFNDSAVDNTTTVLGNNLSVAGIQISGGLRGVGITGTNTLTLGAGGIRVTNSHVGLTLAAPVALGAAQTWTIGDDSVATLTGKLTGSSNPRLTKDGDGTLNLNNNTSGSAYAGVMVVNAGTLNVPFGWNTASLTANVSVGTNGTLVFNSHPYGPNAINTTTNAGSIVVNGDNHLANLELRGGQVAGSGGLRVGDYWGSSTAGKWASRASSITASINVAYLSLYTVNTTFTVENGAAEPDLLVSAPMQNGANGSASFTKTGTGSLTLTQPNTYTGTTTNNQGTLNLEGADNILPAGTGLHLATGTILNLNGYNQSVTRLTGAGTINLGSGAFTITDSATNTTGGIITGAANGLVPDDYSTAPPGGIAMAGAGKVIFTAAQTYTGDTWITSGTLGLSGSGSVSASSNIVIRTGASLDVTARTGASIPLSSGQTLKGNGKVLGAVLVNSNATISPGESVGALSTGAQTWAGSGNYNWEINHATTPGSWDSMSVTGTVNLTAPSGAPFKLRLVSPSGPLPGFNNASNYTWTIANTTGGALNFATNKFSVDTSGLGVDAAGGTFFVEQQGNAVVLRFNAYVAPPSTPPAFTSISFTSGTLSLSATGAPGQTFVLQATTNLAPVDWQLLSTQAVDGSGLVLFTDPQATNHPQRFYRVNLQP